MLLHLVAASLLTHGAPARQPIFIATPARHATWTRMRRDGHPLYRLASANCAKSGGQAERYGDTGLWCAWVFRASGDPAAARRAIGLLMRIPAAPPNANAVRENLMEHVIVADWLWDAMTAGERQAIGAKLDGWSRYAAGKTGKAYEGGFRTFDSDQSVSTYFALAVMDRFNRSVGRAGHWLDSTSTPKGGQQVPIGGTVATDTSRSTARNNVEYYVSRAGGGEWHESEAYNQGTMALLVMGVEAMRTALGRDAFPRATALIREAAARETFAVTPDLLQGVQWGDEEHPRAFNARLYKRVTLLGMLQGATGNAATHRLLLDLWAKHGITGHNSGEPNARLLMLYDPEGPAAANLPTGAHLSAGRGHLYVKNAAELFFAEASNSSNEDHDVKYLSNVALYRNGAWVLDHPLGYGSTAKGAYATNGASYAGFGAMIARRMVRFDSGGGWWAITGETGGPAYANYYDPPPPFLDRATRTTWYTHAGAWSVIVTRDSVQMRDPKSQPKYERFRPEHRWQLDQAGGVWETIWHPAVLPTQAGTGYSWRAPNAETVAVTPFGAGLTSTVIDERQLWPTRERGSGVNLSTRRHQLRIRTTGKVLWTVVTVGRGTPPVPQRTADGVRIGDREVVMVRGVPGVR